VEAQPCKKVTHATLARNLILLIPFIFQQLTTHLTSCETPIQSSRAKGWISFAMGIDDLFDIYRQFRMKIFPILAPSGRKGISTSYAATQLMEPLSDQVAIPA
jgi:hypothetical protein